MHVSSAAVLTSAILSLTLAAPVPNSPEHTAQVTALLTIAPTSSTCAGAPAAGECRTADQAAGPILNAFNKYQISSAGEMAAVLSLMAFETQDFKYNTNHFPGRPGQGTRNMQMPPVNLKYAQSIPELASAGSGDPVQVLRLLTSNDDYDFGSGSWFLATQCPDSVRSGLKTGSQEGWEAYISSCVGTTATPDRQAYWERAKKALGM